VKKKGNQNAIVKYIPLPSPEELHPSPSPLLKHGMLSSGRIKHHEYQTSVPHTLQQAVLLTHQL